MRVSVRSHWLRSLSRVSWLGVAVAAAGVAACGDDEEDPPPPPPETAHFTVRIENVAPFTNRKTGVIDQKVGEQTPGPLAPGEAYEVTFTAGPRHRLVYASMWGQSNDWFFGTDPTGIPLFEDDAPISGDVTDRISLWNAGTEVDEEPAVGPHTGPRQSMSVDGPGGPDPDPNLRRIPDPITLTDGSTFDPPAVAEMIRVSIASDAETREFTLRIENVADDTVTLQTSEGAKPVRISPGVWALGTGGDPIFTEGESDRGEGLEALAEMGDVTGLAEALPAHSGVATPLSPGVWVLHTDPSPLFEDGEPDRGQGLENIAERGDISVLDASLAAALPAGVSEHGTFNTPVGASMPGAIQPGGAYEFEITASPGDRLTFVQMYGASNDWFFGTVESGIALFDGETPIRGDVTDDLRIRDCGTELSEEPAIGPNQGGPEGPADPDANVRIVGADVYATDVGQHIRVTISE